MRLQAPFRRIGSAWLTGADANTRAGDVRHVLPPVLPRKVVWLGNYRGELSVPTVEDAVVFLRKLANGQPRYSAQVNVAAGKRGITPKQLWEAQSIVPVWYANTDTFPGARSGGSAPTRRRRRARRVSPATRLRAGIRDRAALPPDHGVTAERLGRNYGNNSAAAR